MNLLQNIINLDSLSLSQDLNCFSQADLSCHIYMKDKVGKYLNCNDATAYTAGFSKYSDLVKLTDSDLCWRGYAAHVLSHDVEVMKTEKQKVVLEHFCDFNNNPVIVTSIKSPLRSRSKKIIGIIGLSIIQKKVFPVISNRLDLSILTTRERMCLFHLIKGKTAQQIADILYISKRTAEKHLENIKNKLNCKTKSDLIDKAVSSGFIHFNW